MLKRLGAASVAVGLAGCSGGDEGAATGSETATATATRTLAVGRATTENATRTGTGASTDTSAGTPTETPTQTPTETPTQSPTETPTQTSTESAIPVETTTPTEPSTESPAPTGTATPTGAATTTESRYRQLQGAIQFVDVELNDEGGGYVSLTGTILNVSPREQEDFAVRGTVYDGSGDAISSFTTASTFSLSPTERARFDLPLFADYSAVDDYSVEAVPGS